MATRQRIIWIAFAALATAGVQAQHMGGRVFEYRSDSSLFHNVSEWGDVMMDMATELSVKPYLYVAGSLGVTWDIGGWGSSSDEAHCLVTFYHNETLSFAFSNFGDLQKVSGSTTGSQTIPLEMKLQFANNFTGTPLHTLGYVPAGDLNSMMSSSSPLFPAGFTDGQLALNVWHRISLNPGNEPGMYHNPGQLFIVRT